MILRDELERYFQKRTEQDAFSGVVLITRGNSPVFAGSYGYASRSWKVPNTLTTRFDTASVTKLFTSVAILQLIERGFFTFDTSVIDFLGLRDTTIAREVNVYHLLTHTSGIADDAEEEDGEDYADIWKTRANYAVTETADFLPQFAYKPPISRLVSSVATVTAAMCCWASSLKRPVVCPIGTTSASRSSRRLRCCIPISSAWIWCMMMWPRVVIRSAMRMGRFGPGRKISILTCPSGRPMVVRM